MPASEQGRKRGVWAWGGRGESTMAIRRVKTGRLARLTKRSPRPTPIGGMVATLDADRGPFGMLCVHDRLDAFGHQAGDEVLLPDVPDSSGAMAVAQRIREA